MSEQEIEFLRESNAIEGVYNSESLDNAKLAWAFLTSREVITPQVVKTTHRILMMNSNLKDKERGFYRKCEVMIGGRFGLNQYDIEKAMNIWIKQMNLLLPKSMTDLSSKELHVEYEKIHPFVDGNGRTGRMFMNWGRLRNGLSILIIHEGEEQQEYYKWFK